MMITIKWDVEQLQINKYGAISIKLNQSNN